ncbi:MAG: hypothetical protein HS132_08025 [Planctomycetia bacterium]|nr:hypothetical protein [Planctomycetia bacterium]
MLKTNEIFAGKTPNILKQLLSLNETINTVLILKDKLKHIWTYTSHGRGEKSH